MPLDDRLPEYEDFGIMMGFGRSGAATLGGLTYIIYDVYSDE